MRFQSKQGDYKSNNEQKINNNNSSAKPSEDKELNEVLKIRREKLKNLRDEGMDPYTITKFERDTVTTDITENYSEYEGKVVTLAGRLMSKRVMGKMSFADLRDRYGKIQLCVKRDEMGDEDSEIARSSI